MIFLTKLRHWLESYTHVFKIIARGSDLKL